MVVATPYAVPPGVGGTGGGGKLSLPLLTLTLRAGVLYGEYIAEVEAIGAGWDGFGVDGGAGGGGRTEVCMVGC